MKPLIQLPLAMLVAVLPCAAALAATPAAREELHARPLSFEQNLGQAGTGAQYFAHGQGYALALDRDGAALRLGASTLRLSLGGIQGTQAPQAESPLPGKVNYYLGNDRTKWRENVDTYARIRYPAVYPGIDLVYYGTLGRLEYDFDVAPGANPRDIRVNFDGADHVTLDARGNLHVAADGHDVVFDRPLAYQRDDRRHVAARYRVHGRSVSFEVGRHDPRQMLVIDPVLDYFSYLGGSQNDVIGSLSPTGGPPSYAIASNAAAVDGAGNLVVVGNTGSPNFPTTSSAYEPAAPTKLAAQGFWMFVTKFAPDAKSVIFSTYIGGTLGNEAAYGVALDAGGNAFVVGYTGSNDFPVTSGAYQTVCSPNFNNSQGTAQPLCSGTYGSNSAVVAKFSPSGALLDSTFLSGSGTQTSAYAVAVDSTGRPYVAGWTYAGLNIPQGIGGYPPQVGFPTTAGAALEVPPYEKVNNNQVGLLSNNFDAFITVFDPALSTLLYSSLIGDSQVTNGYIGYQPTANTFATAVTLDAAGNFYMAGYSGDPLVQTTPGSLQPQISSCGVVYGNGNPDLNGACGFVVKFSPVTSTTTPKLIYGTYLGHMPYCCAVDQISGIAADAAGDAYVVGFTNDATFPTTAGAYQAGCDQYPTSNDANCGAAFIAKLNPTGTTLLASTYFGGNYAGADNISDNIASTGPIRLDGAGNVYVAGIASDGLAQVNPLGTGNGSGNASPFVAELDPSLTTLLFSTVMSTGGPSQLSLSGLALDSVGNVYLAGSVNAPPASAATNGAFQTSASTGYDGFVAKISLLPFYASGKLTIPTITLGNVTYSNVVVSIAGIVSGPTGTAPQGTSVTFSAGADELTLPEVSFGNTVYYNVVVKPAALVAIGAASNADSFDGAALHIPSLQVIGGAIYSNVVVTIANIDGIAGGVPAAPRDQYNPANKQLFIPAVEYGGKVFTNIVVTVASVVAVQ